MRAVLSLIAPERGWTSIKVLGDNQRAKALMENPLSSARSKYTGVRFHFIRNLFRTQKICVEYEASAGQHADILTKSLSRVKFQYHRLRLTTLSKIGILALGRLFQAAN